MIGIVENCAAPWLELNISAPDNRVTACCYYAGDTDQWGDPSRRLDDYWNGAAMRALRRLQAGTERPKNNGCATCHLAINRPGGTKDIYDLSAMPPTLSSRQAANWRLAHQEWRAGAEIMQARPARVYGNFGFACNISCTMCHQVPRRLDNRRTISADQILSWGDDLELASEMHVIGGEPFAMPEAIKFLRRFNADDRYENVRLILVSNGTVLHKHWQTIHRKQRMSICISLDGIGESFEKVRLGASWGVVERNILSLCEARDRDRPDWSIHSSTLIHKTTLRNLPEFARWHARHRIDPNFSDFISAPGVEDTFHRENFLQNPHLLDDEPAWRDYFDEAIAVFDKSEQDVSAASLRHFKTRVEQSVIASGAPSAASRRRRMRNDWSPLPVTANAGPALSGDGSARDWSGALIATPGEGRDAVPLGERQGLRAFLRTHLGDHLATPLIGVRPPAEGGTFRVRLHWPKFEVTKDFERQAHVAVQGQDYSELPAFREVLDFGLGSDVILTGDLPAGTEAIRIVVTPTGEDTSFVPRRIEIDLDPAVERAEWPRRRPGRGLGRLWTLFGRPKPAHVG